MTEDAAGLENPIDLFKRLDNLKMARGELQRDGIERVVGKWQHMGVTNTRIDREIALAGAALTLGYHMSASVHGMDFKRRIEREKPQRNVVGARTNVEY